MLLDLFRHLCTARLVEPGLGRTHLRGWVRSSSFRYGQVSRDNWLSHEDNDKLTVGRSALLRGPNQLLNGNQERCVLQLCSEGRGRIMR
ncbi:unnamed protein product [Victoria cruziana]